MNKVILTGNLTKDPEKSTTTKGISVAKFTIAVSRKYKNANGEYETDFFNIVAWKELADTCAKYLSKGKKICVVGEIQNRSYDAQDGTKRYITDIIASEIEFLTPKDKSDEPKEKDKKEPEQKINDLGFAPDINADSLPF